MKIMKKIKIFVALISLFYCISLIQDTYAKYVTAADANANITIARWNILVNTQDVKNNSNFSNTITPIFSGTTNINPNVIAPTSLGYFDIIIDGSNTDVSFQYTLNIAISALSDVSDLVITKYTIGSDPTEYTFQDNTYSIQNTILLNAENKTVTYRFYVLWDDTNGAMTNADDTVSANGNAILDVNINFIQLA